LHPLVAKHSGLVAAAPIRGERDLPARHLPNSLRVLAQSCLEFFKNIAQFERTIRSGQRLGTQLQYPIF
jgi:hypothetical protein